MDKVVCLHTENKQLYGNGPLLFTFLLKQPAFKVFSNTETT